MNDSTRTSTRPVSLFRLTKVYLIALSTIALLIIAEHIVIQWTLFNQFKDAYIINIAGRQRMLSQKLSKIALIIRSTTDIRQRQEQLEKFQEALTLWKKAHTGLQFGDIDMNLPGQNSVTVTRQFADIEPHYQIMVSAAQNLLKWVEQDDSIQQFLAEESAFLTQMDAIVAQYELEASTRVKHIRIVTFIIVIIFLIILFLHGKYLFHPVVLRIQQRIQELTQTKETIQEREILLQAVLNNSLSVIYIKDVQGRYLLINRQYEILFHLEREKIFQKTDYDIFPFQIAEAFQANDFNVLNSQQALEFEEQVPQDDGLHTYLSIKFPLYDQHNKICAICGISTDITKYKRLANEELERRVIQRTYQLEQANQELRREISSHQQTEQALQESLNLSQKVLSSLNETVLIINPNTRTIEECNQTTERMFGYQRSELINQTTLILHVNEKKFNQFGEEFRSSVDKQGFFTTEFQMKRKNGEIIATEHFVTSLDQESGQPLKIVSVIRDITERKQAEEIQQERFAAQAAAELERIAALETLQQERTSLAKRVEERTAELMSVNAELAKASRFKDEFLANMSHELRTPLNAILGMAEVLQDGVYGEINAQQIKSLRTVEESGRHLLSLINDILDLAKIEAGKVKLEIIPVSAEGLGNACLRLIKELAHKKHIKTSGKFDPAVTIIQADERYLKQILINLLSNAIKFTPNGGEVKLEIRGDGKRGVVDFTLSDNGVGIAEVDMARLFQPFVQLNGGLNRSHDGTGLGLTLVYRLTELHGGSVTVTSEINKGSCFTVSLPWQPMKIQSQIDNQPFQLEKPSVIEAATATETVVVLADDNLSTLQTLSDYLKIKGYQVIVVYNGNQAIEKTMEEQPDIILMDIQMPGIDGLEAIRQIRAHVKTVAIPIIALTALAMPGDKERCLEAGANDYLIKPVSYNKVVENINKLLDKNSKI